MRVYYYLPGPGHDARSRIGSTTLCSVRRLFFELGGRQGVVQCWTGRQECGHLPRVWRRERFIVQRPLVGDPVRIWIANSQIAARMLQFSNVDVRRRRSDTLDLEQKKDADGGRPASTLSRLASLTPTVERSRLGA